MGEEIVKRSGSRSYFQLVIRFLCTFCWYYGFFCLWWLSFSQSPFVAILFQLTTVIWEELPIRADNFGFVSRTPYI